MRTDRKIGRPAIVTIALALALWAMNTGSAWAAFGFSSVEMSFRAADGSPAIQAGSHPDSMVTRFDLNTVEVAGGREAPEGALKDLEIELPEGLVGIPTATPRCSGVDFATITVDKLSRKLHACSDDTAVGYVGINTTFNPRLPEEKDSLPVAPIYNLVPAPGKVAKFGFNVLGVPVTFEAKLSEEAPYRVIAEMKNTPQPAYVYTAEVVLWGEPSASVHDPYRGKCLTGEQGNLLSLGECPVSNPGPPLLTLPGSCNGPLATRFTASSWGEPFNWLNYTATTPGMSDCAALDFSPSSEARTTTAAAESGTGLDFDLEFKDEGLVSPGGIAQSTVKKAQVTFPEGVTINPSVGENLEACSPAQLAREKPGSVPGEGCPNASKLGTLHVESPLVEEPIDGSIFLAQQDDPATTQPGAENPFDSLIAMYFVIRNPHLGVIVKLPVLVEPDPRTGQLVVTLDNNPQLPFSKFQAHLRAGERAALVTPPACGTYSVDTVLTPWANPSQPVTVSSSFEVTRGVGGGACPPGGVPPFQPGFEAGSVNNNAGSFSPFNMRLTRRDGDQNMTKFSSILPPGQLGSLAGVGKCSDAAVDAAKGKTGKEELASPSCPANSQIGRTLAGAGVGEALTYVPGQLYLGGPYKGAPLSVISVTPAVAGPVDAGTVVVRLGLDLNPKTAEVEVDGAASDPIPHILKGIVLKVRDLRVYVDRPNFTLNPTSCDEMSVRATLFGSYIDVFNPADDVPVNLRTRYQAANCLALGFKPRLGLRLKGGTKRGAHPAFQAVYRPRAGHANLKGMVVRLPRSAFLEQAHIRTICTRVQFAADACPPGSVYGHIQAWTPLLDDPLKGPVYLRSSNHKLPDLVFDLQGLVDIEVATRIDSKKGGIRATLTDLPDAPLTKVVLRMQGGKKGLIQNSANLCASRHRARVKLSGQNGLKARLRPELKPSCRIKKAKGKAKNGKPKKSKGRKGKGRRS
jgi:hypothetical protein